MIEILETRQFNPENIIQVKILTIFFVADGPLGVYPGENPKLDVAVLVWEWGSYLGDKGVNEGAKMRISSFVRPHVNSIMTKGKITGQYVNSVLAKTEAKKAGCEESLLLDPEGYLTEGSGENLFMVRNGVIKTTPLNSILSGITRRTVMEYFASQGKAVQEARFTRDEIWCADEIFVTGTAAEITPVTELDNRKIGRGSAAGKIGPISAQLQKDYQAIVRGEKKVPGGEHWLSFIR
jgi:branched-chain amino acid aminotransferase